MDTGLFFGVTGFTKVQKDNAELHVRTNRVPEPLKLEYGTVICATGQPKKNSEERTYGKVVCATGKPNIKKENDKSTSSYKDNANGFVICATGIPAKRYVDNIPGEKNTSISTLDSGYFSNGKDSNYSFTNSKYAEEYRRCLTMFALTTKLASSSAHRKLLRNDSEGTENKPAVEEEILTQRFQPDTENGISFEDLFREEDSVQANEKFKTKQNQMNESREDLNLGNNQMKELRDSNINRNAEGKKLKISEVFYSKDLQSTTFDDSKNCRSKKAIKTGLIQKFVYPRSMEHKPEFSPPFYAAKDRKPLFGKDAVKSLENVRYELIDMRESISEILGDNLSKKPGKYLHDHTRNKFKFVYYDFQENYVEMQKDPATEIFHHTSNQSLNASREINHRKNQNMGSTVRLRPHNSGPKSIKLTVINNSASRVEPGATGTTTYDQSGTDKGSMSSQNSSNGRNASKISVEYFF